MVHLRKLNFFISEKFDLESNGEVRVMSHRILNIPLFINPCRDIFDTAATETPIAYSKRAGLVIEIFLVYSADFRFLRPPNYQ